MKLTNEQIEFIRRWETFIVNTGGNDVIELSQRKDVNLFSNAPVALLQSCVQSQIALLLRLQDGGFLA